MDFLATARRQMLAGQLHDARERLLASFAGLTEDEMMQPGVAGEWSVRDLLAHLASWDRETTATYRGMLRGERLPFLDLDEEGIQAFNDKHYAQWKENSIDQSVSELQAAREEMLALLRNVDNSVLFAPAPGDEQADFSIAACIPISVNHDEEHAEMIEEWREGRSG